MARKRKLKKKKIKVEEKGKKEKEKNRAAAGPSGEWQAACHLGAHSQHSQNKGRRGKSCGLDMHCFHPAEGSPGSWGFTIPCTTQAPCWGASAEGATSSSISINGELEEAAPQLLHSLLQVVSGLS